MLEPTRHAFPAMGSECAVYWHGDDIGLAAAIEAEAARIESKYSRYQPDSLTTEINRVAAEGGSIELDPESAALVDYAFACFRKSGGLFDVTTGILRRVWDFRSCRIPSANAVAELLPRVGLDKLRWEKPTLSFPMPGMELDFGGIGKEYAADRAAAICRDAGVLHALVEFGGDIAAVGPHPDGTPWTIALRDPRQNEPPRRVRIVRGGLATSGDYERCIIIDGRRYAHILNPWTGWPVEGLASVSVWAESCLIAGSVSTIALLRGEAGKEWLADLGVACLWVDSAGTTGGRLPEP